MTDSDQPSHWNFLAEELGAEAAPRPAKPAAPPPPAAKKRPAATSAPSRPKGSWDDVAALLGVEVPPRPPKPQPPVAAPKPPKPVEPLAAPAAANEAPPETSRHEAASREGASRESRGRRDGGRDGGRREEGRREPPRGRGGERQRARPDSRPAPRRFAEPPEEELFSDEMVSADFVDELVSAEDEDVWTGEPAGAEGEASRSVGEEEPRRGRRRRRRRGGRRSREAAEAAPRDEARDLDEEFSDESQHIDDIVDAIEASPIAEPDDRKPLDEAVAAMDLGDKNQDDRTRGKRRRRRRGRRGDSTGETAARGERDTDADERELNGRQLSGHELDDLELDEDLDEHDEPAGRHELLDDSDSDLEDDDHDARERPSHRAIPSWDEAIGVIVAANMEARAKNPHSGGAQRGRGGRGPRGRGRRP